MKSDKKSRVYCLNEYNDKLALIAGEGVLPQILAKRLIEKGILSLVLVLQGKKERFNFIGKIVFESAPGKINNIINLLKKNNINKIIMLGKIDKRAFLERKGFDFKAIQLLRLMKNGNDMSVFSIIIKELKKIGVEILPQDKYLGDFIVKQGFITKRKPSKKERLDAEFGVKYARQLASMDVGQVVVVKDKVITAVEAIEGTNETIKRGAVLGKTGSVVCKAGRANQDKRFDIPAVGIETLKILSEYNCSLLALEADNMFIIDPDEVIKFADSKKIAIIGI
jgi:UDP-2,3-diacylglucosamine hydrolase